ncbi:hypothetical protein B0H65DRAFT_552371 [Neurospora tetraspora]|uniref:Ankyrin n=1 Tax=Neurospora tetraspora TaxID=94610 RepID=A0AAE0MMS3_9PEZI|nr:hypothetical protein B0H65DRAFT_552371 [Neurospora tetraspora]
MSSPESSHLRFFLTKRFIYIGLAIQADTPSILGYLFNLPDTKTKLLNTTASASYAWYKCISTLSKGLSEPDALQTIKDEALHIAAKSAFPRTTRLLLSKGADPNSPCCPLPLPFAGHGPHTGRGSWLCYQVTHGLDLR